MNDQAVGPDPTSAGSDDESTLVLRIAVRRELERHVDRFGLGRCPECEGARSFAKQAHVMLSGPPLAVLVCQQCGAATFFDFSKVAGVDGFDTIFADNE